MSKRLSRHAAVAMLLAGVGAIALPAHAADKVKVGFVSTLSGPSAALGVDIRDAFLLAVKMNGGKLGGLPAEVIVSDDQFKPDVAKGLFDKNVKRDKVDFMTGVVFSNSCLATAGLNWSSETSTSAGRPPSLPPFNLTASRKPSRMSMPSAADGPDKVLTKPTLTLSAACASGTASSAAAASARRAST